MKTGSGVVVSRLNLLLPPTGKVQDLGVTRVAALRASGVAAAVMCLGLLVPLAVSNAYYMSVLVDGCLLAMFATSIGFLAKRLGLMSLGHSAFYGSAAYGVAIAASQWGWGLTASTFFGLAVGIVLSIAIGSLVVRTPGMSFLMLMLAFGQGLYQLTVQTNLRPLTGGYDGLAVVSKSADRLFGLRQSDLGNAGTFWYVAWVLLVLIVTGFWFIGRSRFGTLLEAIRENEERARFSGFNTYLPRLGAFVISGACASVAGVLFALHAAYVPPEVLSFTTSGDALIAGIIGGLTVLSGPILGGFLYIVGRGELSSSGNLQLFTGVALVLVLYFIPGGILGGLGALLRRIRRRHNSKDGR
jgi:branched-chain amino acid transport system permease protein